MPVFARGDINIHYQELGEGAPVLLIAPGGMRSTIDFWDRAPWSPVSSLAEHFRLILMDQRNAGESSAPVSGEDGWHSYREDQLALLNHLGINRCHLLGMCIGGPYCLALLEAAPERFDRAVLMQPIGLRDNRDAFYAMFNDWQQEIAPQHPEASQSDWDSFRERMYGVSLEYFTVEEEFIGNCATEMVVLMGNDLYHPEATSRGLANLAPRARLIEQWKDGEAAAEVVNFLRGD